MYLSLWDIRENPDNIQFWFSNLTKGDDYSDDIMAIENVQEYYNKMASDYEESMFGWGFCMPEAIADALVKHRHWQWDTATSVCYVSLPCGRHQ